MRDYSIERYLAGEVDPAFAERARFIHTAIVGSRPRRVLDAGCGRGFHLRMLRQFPFIQEIHGIDRDERSLRMARRNCIDPRVRIEHADVNSLPFSDATFDCVICSEVLEHVCDDRQALAEIRRVLMGNGTIVITVPNENFPFAWDPVNWLLMRLCDAHVDKDRWWIAGIWADHERLYRMERLCALLNSLDFEVETMRGAVYHCWPLSHFLLYGVGKNAIDRLGLHDFDRFQDHDSPVREVVARIFRLPAATSGSPSPAAACVSILLTARKRAGCHR